jgi:hypothetical protein
MRAATVAALVLAFPAAGASARQPLFEFGRTGGNIAPFTVDVQADGTIQTSGPVRLAHPNRQLSRPRLATLLRLAHVQRFWSLPHRRLCHDALPDFASLFVTIRSGGKTRTVIVRGGCSPRFTRVYRALAAAATVRQ